MVVVFSECIMKRYVGNNLRVVLCENSEPLTFVGNNIRVKIEKNEGKINIVGDNCRVDVSSGSGKITYTGNNGKFSFGQEETEKKFKYNGNNVKVESLKENPNPSNHQRHTEKENPENCQEYHCDSGTNIFISNSKHVRINSTRIIKTRSSNHEDSTPCQCGRSNLV